jgi:hypothetical protein
MDLPSCSDGIPVTLDICDWAIGSAGVFQVEVDPGWFDGHSGAASRAGCCCLLMAVAARILTMSERRATPMNGEVKP